MLLLISWCHYCGVTVQAVDHASRIARFQSRSRPVDQLPSSLASISYQSQRMSIKQKYYSSATLRLLQYSIKSTCPPLPPRFILNPSTGIFRGTKKHLKIKIHQEVDVVLFLFCLIQSKAVHALFPCVLQKNYASCSSSFCHMVD